MEAFKQNVKKYFYFAHSQQIKETTSKTFTNGQDNNSFLSF